MKIILLCLIWLPLWAENVIHDMLPVNHTDSVEFYFLKPEGDGPFPVVFLLHGHQPIEKSIGAKESVNAGYLNTLADEGIVAVAISMRGYGQSSGKRDSSGPRSQANVRAVIEYFKALPWVDSSRMGIYGTSRGAILSSMVSCNSPDMALQILEAGTYDLTSRKLPFYLEEINKNALKEAGSDPLALKERSVVFYADQIQAKTLFLFGEFDDRNGLPSAQALHTQLLARGIESHLHIFPNVLHVLPPYKWEIILPFLRAQFFDLYGIGINFSQPYPIAQISKILKGSSAEFSQKLKVGDALLRISPLNDENEIDLYSMPKRQLISLILGKKGTFLRLHIYHFDGAEEDIVVERK